MIAHRYSARSVSPVFGPCVLASFEHFAQLYAEPSAIQYIRTKFDLKDVVIVSPDAGGAKRYVIRYQ